MDTVTYLCGKPKQMKKTTLLILLLIASVVAITFVGCKKQYSPHREDMNYEQLSKILGASNAFDVFDRSGLTEQAIGGTARSTGKKVKDGATVAVWFNTITLTVTGSSIVYTTKPGSTFGGVTKFVSQTSNDGALGIWDCNRYWGLNEILPPDVTCTDTATSGYNLRAFVSNSQTAEVDVSNWVIVL